jgi:hypothetical protein
VCVCVFLYGWFWVVPKRYRPTRPRVCGWQPPGIRLRSKALASGAHTHTHTHTHICDGETPSTKPTNTNGVVVVCVRLW